MLSAGWLVGSETLRLRVFLLCGAKETWIFDASLHFQGAYWDLVSLQTVFL